MLSTTPLTHAVHTRPHACRIDGPSTSGTGVLAPQRQASNGSGGLGAGAGAGGAAASVRVSDSAVPGTGGLAALTVPGGQPAPEPEASLGAGGAGAGGT